MAIGKPTPVVKFAIETTSRAVIAVIIEVSLIMVAVARRLHRLASLSHTTLYDEETFLLQTNSIC